MKLACTNAQILFLRTVRAIVNLRVILKFQQLWIDHFSANLAVPFINALTLPQIRRNFAAAQTTVGRATASNTMEIK
ncbi:unnamed protein product [Coffea canephora]|uniref:Uncharacterized protein n=1 Tax=Coffea canephora TaxID=49390 RepID=A0A068U3F5_COFCA|nr:unnamed protein product [Coffea canephora]